MMFSAICEELGCVFGICLILVCMSCFIMFANIAMQLTNRYYRLVAVGLGTTYAVQTFLTVGGATKLIPLTGVTLPLVSYGGSSMLSTLIMFAIVQGLYMLQRDEESKAEKRIQEAWSPYHGEANYTGVQEGYYEDDRYAEARETGYGSEGRNGWDEPGNGFYDPDGYFGPRYEYYADDGPDYRERPYQEERYDEKTRRK